jgi:septal ring factor EnvC (AmiA/AmiB activator)
VWFAFPNGTSSISVERQEFYPEVTTENGTCYFRAPEHFAPRILAITGFTIADAKGLPEDLPKSDPLRDSAIAELSITAEAQRNEIQNLRSDMASLQAKLAALTNENANLTDAIQKKDIELENLREEIEDK